MEESTQVQEQVTTKRKYKKRKKANPTNWGGARDGAGRPVSVHPDEKLSATISFCVPESTKRKWSEIKKRGINPSAYLIESLDNLAALLGIE